MSRQTWLQILHRQSKDKSKHIERNGIQSYEETEKGVVVTTEKGDKFEGDILVGVDGVHNTIRNLMADNLKEKGPATAKALREAFTAEWHCLFATSKNERKDGTPIMKEGMISDLYDQERSGLVVSGMPGKLIWFFYLKSDPVTKTPHVTRYSQEDAEEAMRKHRHLPVGKDYTFKDLWDARIASSMAAMEEGIVKPKWNRGRVVLVGDAVHKCTINPGLGGQLGLEGCIHLVNGLVSLLKRSTSPNAAELTTMFDARQRKRAPLIVALSGYQTRMEAQAGWMYRFLWKCVYRLVPDWLMASATCRFVLNGSPCLDFLPRPRDVLS